MEKVFVTKKGVELYLDIENYSAYKCEDIDAVKAALREDISYQEIDPIGAKLASNLLTIIEDIDRMAS